MSSYTPFEQEVLASIKSLDQKVSSLESEMRAGFERIDARMDESDQKTDALWKLSNQAFQAINEVRSEVAPPWRAQSQWNAAKK